MKKAFEYRALRLEQVPCPLCRSKNFRILARTDRYRMGLTTSGCLGCGLVMTNPRPEAGEMHAFYANFYRSYYQSVEFPDSHYIAQFHKDERARYTADFLLQQKLLKDGGRILDLGAAEGSLLREIRARSHSATLVAVEPNDAFRRFAERFVPCRTHSSMGAVKVEAGFDLIVINHVLEHAMDPVAFLADATDLLAEHGHIYVDVPALEFYRDVSALHIAHLFHFTRKTIALAARVAGLELSLCEYHQPPHHPRSIRCVMRVRNPSSATDQDHSATDEQLHWKRVDRARRLAWAYHLRHSGMVSAARRWIPVSMRPPRE